MTHQENSSTQGNYYGNGTDGDATEWTNFNVEQNSVQVINGTVYAMMQGPNDDNRKPYILNLLENTVTTIPFVLEADVNDIRGFSVSPNGDLLLYNQTTTTSDLGIQTGAYGVYSYNLWATVKISAGSTTGIFTDLVLMTNPLSQ